MISHQFSSDCSVGECVPLHLVRIRVWNCFSHQGCKFSGICRQVDASHGFYYKERSFLCDFT